jgi:hypothetical protein
MIDPVKVGTSPVVPCTIFSDGDVRHLVSYELLYPVQIVNQVSPATDRTKHASQIVWTCLHWFVVCAVPLAIQKGLRLSNHDDTGSGMPAVTLKHLCMPAPVNNLAPVLLALLQSHLRFLFRHVDRIDVSSRLDTESSAGATSREAFDCRDIDVLASVELERWLCTGDLQMNLAFWVIERRKFLYRSRAGVDWDVLRVFINNEAMVNVWFLLS